MALTSFLTFALACSSVALVAAAPAQDMPADALQRRYDEKPFEWDVQAFRDGPNVTLHGTVEQVYAQLLNLNPNYDADFADFDDGSEEDDEEDDGFAQSPADVGSTNGTTVVKRTNFNVPHASTTCFLTGTAYTNNAKSGVKYLRKVKGRPRNGPGPNNCGRVSCSFWSAIWWCNNTKGPKTLRSFGSIADGAEHIINQCSKNGKYNRSGGRAYHKTNWSVEVKYAHC